MYDYEKDDSPWRMATTTTAATATTGTAASASSSGDAVPTENTNNTPTAATTTSSRGMDSSFTSSATTSTTSNNNHYTNGEIHNNNSNGGNDEFHNEIIMEDDNFGDNIINVTLATTATTTTKTTTANNNDQKVKPKGRRWGRSSKPENNRSTIDNSSSNNNNNNNKSIIMEEERRSRMLNDSTTSNTSFGSMTSPTTTNNSNNTNNTSTSSGGSWLGSKGKEIRRMEAEMYRERRHAFYADFLLLTADLLMLDRSHAVAFLPLLNSMLETGGGDGGDYGGGNTNNNGNNNGSNDRMERNGNHHRQNHQTTQERRQIYNTDCNSNDLNLSLSSPKGKNDGMGCLADEGLLRSWSQSNVLASNNNNNDTIGIDPKCTDDGNDGETNELLLRSWSNTDEQQHDLSSQRVGSEYNQKNNGDSSDRMEHNSQQTSPPSTSSSPPPILQSMQTWDQNDLLDPFVESLSPGAGFQCVTLLMLNHLLQNGQGYDARVRHVLKKLVVVILRHEMRERVYHDYYCNEGGGGEEGGGNNSGHESGGQRHHPGCFNDEALVMTASRKFEQLEHSIAKKLLDLSEAQEEQEKNKNNKNNKHNNSSSSNNYLMGRKQKERQQQKQQQQQQETTGQIAPKKSSSSWGGGSGSTSRESMLRGLKIGSAGVVAGTLFAVTGGLAAPGIAAGLAALGATTAATAAVVTTLTSTAAVTTIFGVGGGGLIAYKTHRVTKGVTEFEFQKEDCISKKQHNGSSSNKDEEDDDDDDGRNYVDAQLFSTICLSGWLRDSTDFQRPWGVKPTNPPIFDKVERLSRFYTIYKPENLNRIDDILRTWRGKEKVLWAILRRKYGRDPDNILPLDGPRHRAKLTHGEEEVIDNLLNELGFPVSKRESYDDNSCGIQLFHNARMTNNNTVPHKSSHNMSTNSVSMLSTQSSNQSITENISVNKSESTTDIINNGSIAKSKTPQQQLSEEELIKKAMNEFRVWDYQAEYGGELYTVRWESDLLMELCDSVTDMAVDLIRASANQILLHSAMAGLMMGKVFLVSGFLKFYMY